MAFLIASAVLLILVILASILVKASFRSNLDDNKTFSISDIIELALVIVGVGLVYKWVDIGSIKYSLIGLLIGGYLLTRNVVANGLNKVFNPKNAAFDFEKLSDSQSLDIIKKYEVSKISRKKSIYFFSGLLIALIFTTLLVEYKTITTYRKEIVKELVFEEEEIIDVPIIDVPPPPPPKPKVTPVIKEVPDETLIEEPEIEIEPEEEEVEEVVYEEEEEEEEEVIEEDNSIFNLYELQQKPEYPGGMAALLGYVQRNYKVPSRDIEEGNKGKIFVQFVIEKNGRVGDVTIARGINDRLNKEAIRVIKSLPKWSPGMNAGAPARVRYVFPITIKF